MEGFKNFRAAFCNQNIDNVLVVSSFSGTLPPVAGCSHSWLLLHRWCNPGPWTLSYCDSQATCTSVHRQTCIFRHCALSWQPPQSLRYALYFIIVCWKLGMLENEHRGNMLTLALQAVFSDLILDRYYNQRKLSYCLSNWHIGIFSVGLWVVLDQFKTDQRWVSWTSGFVPPNCTSKDSSCVSSLEINET